MCSMVVAVSVKNEFALPTKSRYVTMVEKQAEKFWHFDDARLLPMRRSNYGFENLNWRANVLCIGKYNTIFQADVGNPFPYKFNEKAMLEKQSLLRTASRPANTMRFGIRIFF